MWRYALSLRSIVRHVKIHPAAVTSIVIRQNIIGEAEVVLDVRFEQRWAPAPSIEIFGKGRERGSLRDNVLAADNRCSRNSGTAQEQQTCGQWTAQPSELHRFAWRRGFDRRNSEHVEELLAAQACQQKDFRRQQSCTRDENDPAFEK